ncbi:hypothetical protein CCR75_009379 [Bremia lactucae]|uniref:Uncharacterized protein n=1 Tax=Bremia lactucae TaxID=4779 RepID=A0A976FHF1_BRELC|nr:hypothetical protein CCR75_009379 [Bremia lactucae]
MTLASSHQSDQYTCTAGVLIVDLVYNDSGVVARVGPVHMPFLMGVVTYTTLPQLLTSYCRTKAAEVATAICSWNKGYVSLKKSMGFVLPHEGGEGPNAPHVAKCFCCAKLSETFSNIHLFKYFPARIF